MKNILKEICDRRLQDIEKKGFSYGHEIPLKRTRPVVPFLLNAGTILEVKRASPSKGDIAPNLDSVATAKSYARDGGRDKRKKIPLRRRGLRSADLGKTA